MYPPELVLNTQASRFPGPESFEGQTEGRKRGSGRVWTGTGRQEGAVSLSLVIQVSFPPVSLVLNKYLFLRRYE